MLYGLVLDCPVPWADHPVYPIDPTPCEGSNVGASTSQVSLDAFFLQQPSQTSSSPQKPGSNLRELILDTLFSSTEHARTTTTLSRISTFLRRVSRQAARDPATLRDALEPVKELEEKFRSIYKALDGLGSSSGGHATNPAAVLEALADNTTLNNDECVRVQQAHAAFLKSRETKKVKQSLRDWNSSLEVLAHEIQAVLLLQLMSLDGGDHQEGTEHLSESLEFITDRLAIRQAMLGLSLDLNQDSAEGNTMDEIQQFWVMVEKHFDLKPAFWASHRSKLFPDSLFSDSDPGTPSSKSNSPAPADQLAMSESDEEDGRSQQQQQPPLKKRAMLHPTPDLIRLAAKAKEQRAQQEQEASLRMPASPTMAKLLGATSADKAGASRASRESSVSTAASSRRGTFQRANSMPMAVGPNMAKQRSLSREVSMRQRTTSVEPQAHQQQQRPGPSRDGAFGAAATNADRKKPRLSKRKQLSPKKHAPGPSSHTDRGLLVHSKTPSKLKLRPKGQRAPSFADLGRLFRPGSALLVPPSSDVDYPGMFDEPEAQDDDLIVEDFESPMSRRTNSAPKAIFAHQLENEEGDNEMGQSSEKA